MIPLRDRRNILNSIDKVLESAHFINPPNFEENSANIDLVTKQIKKAENLSGNLYIFESAAKEKIIHILTALRNNLQALNKEKEQLDFRLRTSKQFRHLSLDLLTWRDTEGFPRFVIFNINELHFGISVSFSQLKIFPNLPNDLKDCYKDVEYFLNKASRKRGINAYLSYTFGGLIPRSVKNTIRDSHFSYDNIFILAETTNCSFTETISLSENKMLIVGYSPLSPESLWLITQFYPMSVEEAMNMENND